MRSLLALAAAALALPSLLACNSVTSASSGSGGGTSSSSGGGPACDDPAAPDVYEVGTGEQCFERLTPGQTVPVLQGPQGGYHIWLAVGCGDCGGQAILEWGVKDPATGTWFADTSANKGVVELDADGWGQRAGITAFLPGIIYDPDTALPKGTHVILAASVLDSGGATVHTGEVEVVLGDTDVWDPPCDENPSTCGTPGGRPCCGQNF